MKIAIDGPAGAGKSTVAKQIAQRLGFVYVDTGAMYRTIALAALRAGIPAVDEEPLQQLLKETTIEIRRTEDGQQEIFLNGENATEEIRFPKVTNVVSHYSALASVRKTLTDLQRKIAAQDNVVMDGRDIGSVVLPEADVKIFLTASVEERARRRALELRGKGLTVSECDLQNEIAQRDENDRNRVHAPLIETSDAIKINSDSLTIDEVCSKILENVKNNWQK